MPRTGAQRLGSASGRTASAWRGLPPERRLAAGAALALFVTLFLPWYQETVIASGLIKLQSSSASLTGWGAFSFVEAAVLLVAAGVLFLLFMRAEGNAFHVPGGDGGVITAAGIWTCLLIVWRMFDKEGTTGHGQYATTWGIEWGIFVALAVAAVLTYAGTRIRHAHEPEPPLPGDVPGPPRAAREARGARRGRPARSSSAHTPSPSGSGSGSRSASGSGSGSGPAEREHPIPTFEVDDSWRAPKSEATTQVVADPAQPAGPATPRRVRPRSIRGTGEPPTAPTQPAAPARAPAPARSEPAASEPAGSEDPTLPQRRRRTRGLDIGEIQELDIAEPPTARLGRPKPSRPGPPAGGPGSPDGPGGPGGPGGDDPEDQRTLRLDRPR